MSNTDPYGFESVRHHLSYICKLGEQTMEQTGLKI